MKKSLIMLCFFVPVHFSYSLDESPIKTWSSRIYFFSGYRNIDFRSLNTELQTYKWPLYQNHNISLGLLSTVVLNDIFIFGFEGQTILKQSFADNASANSLGSFAGFFNLGMQFLNASGFTVYSLLGAGFGTLQLKNFENYPLTFPEALANPRRGLELNYSTALFGISLGADYMINLAKGKDKGGFLAGFRIGYILEPFEGSWDMNYTKISNGLNLDLSGFYVLFMFGGGIQSYENK